MYGPIALVWKRLALTFNAFCIGGRTVALSGAPRSAWISQAHAVRPPFPAAVPGLNQSGLAIVARASASRYASRRSSGLSWDKTLIRKAACPRSLRALLCSGPPRRRSATINLCIAKDRALAHAASCLPQWGLRRLPSSGAVDLPKSPDDRDAIGLRG